MDMPLKPATKAGAEQMRQALRLAAAVGFLALLGVYATLNIEGLSGLSNQGLWFLIVAAVVGGYMAMNIGANDVANNMGPAVGSGAISLGWAILIAAVFEALGAIIAGGDVVGTIKGGIIDPAEITDPALFAWVMFAALLAGALWLNLATALGAPVSTTHSIIGAVMGAGIAAGGWGLVNWGTIWIISPLSGGLIAAAFLYLIKRSVTYKSDKTEAAARVVPLLIGAMAWSYGSYMLLKGLGQLVKVGFVTGIVGGLVIGIVTWALVPCARTTARTA